MIFRGNKPERATPGSAGYDLRTPTGFSIEPGGRELVPINFKIEYMSPALVGIIKPRSGLAVKHGIDVMAGVIDSDYTGDIKVLLINHGKEVFKAHEGEYIAQLVIVPFYLADNDCFRISKRGDGGFGSTDE